MRLATTLLDFLRRSGIRIQPSDVDRIRAEQEKDPSASTGDLVVRLGIADEATVSRVIDMAKHKRPDLVLSEESQKARSALADENAAWQELCARAAQIKGR